MTQAYATLIADDLAHDRFNQAVALAAMLTMARDDGDAQLLADVTRYLAGQTDTPPDDPGLLDGVWLDYAEQRAQPRPGTAFALLACAESEEWGEVPPAFCELSTEALVKAADDYDNEVIHRYLVTRLLRSNRVAEAQRVLETHYITDSVFRIRHQLALAYFLRDSQEEDDRYCRLCGQRSLPFH